MSNHGLSNHISHVNGIGRALLLTRRSTARDAGGYVNTREMAPRLIFQQLWEEFALPLAQARLGRLNPQLRTIGSAFFFVAHVRSLLLRPRYQDAGKIPIASNWLRQNFRLEVSDVLNSMICNPARTIPADYRSGRCTLVWPSEEFLCIALSTGQDWISAWDFASSMGVKVGNSPFQERVGIPIAELITQNLWVHSTLQKSRVPDRALRQLDQQTQPSFNSNRDFPEGNPTKQSPFLFQDPKTSPTFLMPTMEPDATLDPWAAVPDDSGAARLGSWDHADQMATGATPTGITDRVASITCRFFSRSLKLKDLGGGRPVPRHYWCRVDLEAGEAVVETLPESRAASARACLEYIKANTKDGMYLAHYSPVEFCGRVYELNRGLQGAPRELKQALMKKALDQGSAYNYDLSKCQARGLLLLFEHLKIDTTPLQSFVNHYARYAADLDLGGRTDLLKLAMYCQVWGGRTSWMVEAPEGRRRTACAEEFARAFGTRVGRIRLDEVTRLLQPISAAIREAQKQVDLPLGEVLTNLEQMYIHSLVTVCFASGINVLSLQHDGVITDAPIPEELSDLAAQISGFTNARLVQKDFFEPALPSLELEVGEWTP